MAAALRTALCLAFMSMSTLVVGCTATEDDADDDEGTTSEAASELNGHRRRRNKGDHGQAGDGRPARPWARGHHGKQTIPVSAPEGNFIAEVNANGTGCPEGSWDASISEDGQTFTLRMNQYEAAIQPNEDRATKDCRVSVKLSSPQGMSYSVASFFYSGYVFLDQEGMRGAYSAKYSFAEDPRGTMRQADRDITRGPSDQEFVFASDPRPVWSPCGGTSTLNVDTRITVMNNRRKTGSAFMNNSAVDGSIGNNDGTLAMKWRLGWRRCR